MATRTTFLAERLFDGGGGAAATDRLVHVDRGRILAIEPAEGRRPADAITVPILAPGFIDLQINGAGDALFNDTPDAQTIGTIAAAARKGGTAHLLPTYITAPGTGFTQALAAVADAVRAGVPGILGVHLEGPFLSPARPGIHPPDAIRPLTGPDCDLICRAAPLMRLVTLAPERQDPALLKRLIASGVRVFAGHSEASDAQMAAAADAGLIGATHLFNAMPPLAGRQPGIVGAVLAEPGLFAGIIADAIHVAPRNLSLAARLMPERLCLVTDAMPTLAGKNTQFTLMGRPIRLIGNRLEGTDGTLAGAHLSMIEAVRNMMALADVSPGRAIAMASANPARALGLERELGAISPGYRASMTLLDDSFAVRQVMVDGRLFAAAD